MRSIVLLLILAFTASVYAQQVKGYVYNDENNNRTLDSGEEKLDNILVSNGREIVKTADNGYYELNVNDGDVVFIIKPTGYKTYIDELNLPRFYYIYKPEGSPELKFGGIKPTGKLAGYVNFPLYETSEEENFKFLALGDPQPADNNELDYIRDDIVAELAGTNASFSIALGDIAYDDLSLYPRYNKIMSKLGHTIYNVPGNHDMDYDAVDDKGALDTFKEIYGPAYYSFNYGKMHFVVLDDVEYHGVEEKGKYHGLFGDTQLNWLKHDLELVPEHFRVVLTMHIPVWHYRTSKFTVDDTHKLLEIIKSKENLLLLSGHLHTNENIWLTEKEGWTGEKPLHSMVCGAICGSWWHGPRDDRNIPVADQRDGAPNGYMIFEADGSDYSYSFKAARFDEDFQIRISAPKGTLDADLTKGTEIAINVFNADVNWKVEAYLDDTKLTIEQKLEKDPHFKALVANNPDTWTTWIRAIKTGHIWFGKISEKLEPGVHTIKAVAEDAFGKKYSSTRLIEVK